MQLCYINDNITNASEKQYLCNVPNYFSQTVSLTSLVFDNEGPPSRALRVYVRVQDVSALVISAGFISRWMAYTSSVMDLWRAGDVVMPRGPIVPAPTNATVMIYAGDKKCINKIIYKSIYKFINLYIHIYNYKYINI